MEEFTLEQLQHVARDINSLGVIDPGVYEAETNIEVFIEDIKTVASVDLRKDDKLTNKTKIILNKLNVGPWLDEKIEEEEEEVEDEEENQDLGTAGGSDTTQEEVGEEEQGAVSGEAGEEAREDADGTKEGEKEVETILDEDCEGVQYGDEKYTQKNKDTEGVQPIQQEEGNSQEEEEPKSETTEKTEEEDKEMKKKKVTVKKKAATKKEPQKKYYTLVLNKKRVPRKERYTRIMAFVDAIKAGGKTEEELIQKAAKLYRDKAKKKNVSDKVAAEMHMYCFDALIQLGLVKKKNGVFTV